jgi:hypothetical protein
MAEIHEHVVFFISARCSALQELHKCSNKVHFTVFLPSSCAPLSWTVKSKKPSTSAVFKNQPIREYFLKLTIRAYSSECQCAKIVFTGKFLGVHDFLLPPPPPPPSVSRVNMF